MRILVTGGAGFLGSHLCERLLAGGDEVVSLDSLLTGNPDNLASVARHPRFGNREGDVAKHIEIEGDLDWVLHFASPASPVDFTKYPIHILKVGALGTLNAMGVAKAKGAGFFLASSSEVYGDPLVHPQPETYWGNVNPIGPRGVYDEAKRFAEAMTYAYHRTHGVPVRVARYFNSFGPRMRRDDGRAVPTFIAQALAGEPITVHGDGSQTRSLSYVTDTIEASVSLLESETTEPVNIGSPNEVTVLELAKMIRRISSRRSEIVFVDRPVDDPGKRRPDISRAQERLGWSPRISLEEGLALTIEWCRANWR